MTQNINLTDKALEQVNGGINDFPEYDMIGIVVGKHQADPYAYDVKGDNDVIYICYYDETGDITPGTEVYMFHNNIDNTWQIRLMTFM